MEEYEIDLRDYFRIMWQKKWWILGVFLGSLLMAAVFSFSSPNQYRAEAIYRVGDAFPFPGTSPSAVSSEVLDIIVMDKNTLEEYLRFANRVEVATATLASQELQQEAWKALIPEERLASVNLKVTTEKGNLLKLELRGTLAPEVLAQALSALVKAFSARAQDEFREQITKEILKIQQRRDRLQAEELRLRQEIHRLVSSADATSLKVGELDATLEGLLLRLELSSLYSQLASVQAELSSLSLALQELQDLRGSTWEPLVPVSSPFASTTPVGPNRKMNLAVAGVLGLFVGVLLAFFVHWLQTGPRPEEKTSPQGSKPEA